MRPASHALVMPQVLNYLLLLRLEVVSFLISTLEPLLLPLQEPLVLFPSEFGKHAYILILQ